jgi:hypothetical protein
MLMLMMTIMMIWIRLRIIKDKPKIDTGQVIQDSLGDP